MHRITFIVLLASSVVAASDPLEHVGKPLTLPFPNEQKILGVGGIDYDAENDLWSASSENIASFSLPRLYHMKLDFFEDSSDVEFVLEEPLIVQPSSRLKLEGLAIVPETTSTSDSVDKDVWLASESHSSLVTTSKFLSKDFGPPDLSSFDRGTISSSRLVRVNGASGEILEEATLPDFVRWDLEYDWESTNCIGERPFAGLHALSIVPSSDPKYTNIMFAAYQTALYQDGSSPTDFSGSATRILVYGLESLNNGDDRTSKTASYLNSYRYDTSKLTLKSYQKGSSHFNALFGILALDEKSLFVTECEDLTSVGVTGQKVVNRIYYVELNDTVDHCHSLLHCNVTSPSKRLIWESESNMQLDEISWGPTLDDGRRSVVLAFENDEKVGIHFELLALNETLLKSYGEVYDPIDISNKLLRERKMALSISVGLLACIFVVQLLWIRRLETRSQANGNSPTEITQQRPASYLNFSAYALTSVMVNSFLVGGVTFGYSGMVLMLRKEGAYAENFSCGTFCSKQKEQLALISSLGFATAIGSRLFIGMFMDSQGPKLTSVICSLIFLSGVSILASASEDKLTSKFLPAWILISLGGSGLHITGFHFTNLFPGEGKKRASAKISAAFGASSAIFPIMQVFNQYADVRMQTMMRIYTALVCLLVINNFIIQPWSKVRKEQVYTPKLNILHRSWWERNIGQKPTFSSIKNDMVKFEFYGEAIIYSILLFLLTHYLSTSSQLLYEKGDIPFTSNPNDWSDFMIARMAGWFNALGFIWLPTVKHILTKFEWPRLYLFLCVLNIVIVAIVLINNLELQILGFALLAFARLMLFSCHHAYLIDTFGMTNFGNLNGISSFLAAILSFSSYPLQLVALQTTYAISFIPIGVLVLLSIFIPISLWKCHKNYQGKKEELQNVTLQTVSIDESRQKIQRIQQSGRDTVMNWAETVSVDPTIFRYPESVEEVVSLVISNSKIRCAGALHSCAPLIESEGIIMSMTKLEKILSIDAENMIVRCQSGARIHDICKAIAPYNMALGTLGTIDWQTISGAVMTGTHGGALTVPSLHTFVNSYTLVKPDGKIISISRASDPVLFSAMAPSMGVFGAVVEMEIQCVPLQILEAKMEVIDFDQLIDSYEVVMRSNKYCRVVVYSSINRATIWTANPVSSREEAIERGAANSPGYTNFRDDNEKDMLMKYLNYCNGRNYLEADLVLEQVLKSQMNRLRHYVGQYNHILCKERNNGIPHADIEFNFDFEKNKEVLRTVKKYCGHNRIPYYNFEIRATQKDDAMLSCCQGRDAMWIDFQAKADVSKEFFDEIECLFKPIGFRKHWAKGMDNTSPEYVATQFPRLREFLLLMKEFDPEGKFRNNQSEGWFQTMDSVVLLGSGNEPGQFKNEETLLGNNMET